MIIMQSRGIFFLFIHDCDYGYSNYLCSLMIIDEYLCLFYFNMLM